MNNKPKHLASQANKAQGVEMGSMQIAAQHNLLGEPCAFLKPTSF